LTATTRLTSLTPSAPVCRAASSAAISGPDGSANPREANCVNAACSALRCSVAARSRARPKIAASLAGLSPVPFCRPNTTSD